MLAEYFFQKLFEGAIAVAKDVLATSINKRNEEARNEKKRKAEEKEQLSVGEISQLTLSQSETSDGVVNISTPEAYKVIRTHIDNIRLWSASVGFSDLQGTKTLSDIFVSLDTYLTPRKLHLAISEQSNTVPLQDAVFKSRRHCMILGQPGAGKTTSMQKLCAELLKLIDQGQYTTIPLLIRFRDIKDQDYLGNIILRELAMIFPLQYQFGGFLKSDEAQPFVLELKEASLLRFIDGINVTIIIDGFDEYPNSDRKPRLAQELRKIATSLNKSRLIVTCRTGEFNYEIENSDKFEIAPLSDGQIRTFATHWIGDSNGAERFLDALHRSPFADTAMKPLSLAHLCAIYERIGTIPDRPKTVYRKIVTLLLEDWDQQRSIKRPSRYAKFEADRKFEFLSHLAFTLTTQVKSSVFGRRQLIASYEQICIYFGLDSSQANLVVAELESHTGLFLQSGFDGFEFAHKSLQEYLTAEYIVKLPSIPDKQNTLTNLGAELAIAVAVSSNSNLYFVDLALNILSRMDLPAAFYNAFFGRLILEKPDFYVEDQLTLALFCALSMSIYRGRIESDQHHLTESVHDDEKKCMDLLKLILQPEPGAVLMTYYEVKADGELNGDIMSVERKRHIDKFTLPKRILVPRYVIN